MAGGKDGPPASNDDHDKQTGEPTRPVGRRGATQTLGGPGDSPTLDAVQRELEARWRQRQAVQAQDQEHTGEHKQDRRLSKDQQLAEYREVAATVIAREKAEQAKGLEKDGLEK